MDRSASQRNILQSLRSAGDTVFKNVHKVEFEIDSYDEKLEIDNLKTEDESSPINAQFIGRASE